VQCNKAKKKLLSYVMITILSALIPFLSSVGVAVNFKSQWYNILQTHIAFYNHIRTIKYITSIQCHFKFVCKSSQ
jgi:hypothetical protein